MKGLWAKLRLWLAMLLLLALSVGGFWGLLDQWTMDRSYGALFSNAAQTAYAMLGLAAILGLFMKARWARLVLWAWGVALFLTGVTAPLIWSDQGPGAAAVAGVIMLVCTVAVMWLAWPASARH
jgi:hypothetical protein